MHDSAAGGPERGLGAGTALAAVIASMVGTGALTTSGLLLATLGSPAAVLLAWLIGGAAALAGALSYAELGAALPTNGGEYRLLGRIYHPAVGFVAGWISVTVGFAAGVAAVALGFGHYLAAVVPVSPPLAGAALLVAVSVIQAGNVSAGARFGDLATIAKVAVVAALPVLLLAIGKRPVAPVFRWDGVTGWAPFALGLILVSFAYTGWNTAVYVAGEIREPRRSLPRALIGGTLVVTALYLLLNVALLAAAPSGELAGVVEVAHVAAVRVFGAGAGAAVSLAIAVLLVSSASALTLAGPRVLEAMGEDFPRLRVFAVRRAGGGPARAIGLQTGLALVFLATASFGTILTFTGFLLAICSGVTALGVIVLRRREPGLARPYRVPLYPLPPLLFAALSGWMAVAAWIERPAVVLVGAGVVAAGLVLYLLVRGDARGSRR
jgi:APA family basic amino acid/polyamine antiporter